MNLAEVRESARKYFGQILQTATGQSCAEFILKLIPKDQQEQERLEWLFAKLGIGDGDLDQEWEPVEEEDS